MNELRESRKRSFDEMERKLKLTQTRAEDSMFCYHSSQERIVLSHALFWTMTLPQNFKGKIRKEKFFLLLRQYQEEMLDAYLQDDDYFPELLRYCNIMFETMPMMLKATHDMRKDKEARKLAAIAIVAAGYGGDMPENLANELLDDMDFVNNRAKCRKIETMMLQLGKMVEAEMS